MVVRIAEKPDFRTETIAEVCQNNIIDDKPPNSYFVTIPAKKTSKSTKKDLNFLDKLDILWELKLSG